MLKSIKGLFPWYLKIFVKLCLSRLPISYGFWKSIGIFEHGDMNKCERSYDAFIEHARTGKILTELECSGFQRLRSESISILEIGPGDSLFSAVIAKAMGAKSSWMVDVGPYAIKEVVSYIELHDFLGSMGSTFVFDKNPTNLDAVLENCDGRYLTDGIGSLSKIPDTSIGYCFSNAVLEHIPLLEFQKLAEETLRILAPEGVCVHRVDLKDHLGGGLNNLRFTERTWEGAIFKNSGFYTNRLRMVEIVAIFENSGFDCELLNVQRWDHLPLPRKALSECFQKFSDNELSVSEFDIVLTRREK